MSEEVKQPPEDEVTPGTAPESAETPPPPAEEEKTGKSKKDGHKKEKFYTLTREQMEAAELAARQLAAAKEQYARLAAEYDNYRKRTTKEKEGIYQDAKVDMLKEFLAVYDNLERAVATEGGENSPHKKGAEMIFQQFQEILKNQGVTEIQAIGAPFDPEKHNAVMHVEDETLGENVVADVFQTGFMLGEKVLRFATVRVAN